MKVKNISGLILIMTLVIWSCNNSSSSDADRPSLKQDDPTQTQQTTPTNTEQIELKTPQQNTTQAGEPDQYGRLPGDEHYGHNHPPQDQQQTIQPNINTQQNNLNGGPDKYGRNPGDEHYGHDHQ